MSFTLGTLLGSAGIAQIAGDALDKVNEIIFGERTKDLLQDVKDRSRAFLTSVPTNHDLERAIRYTELTSTIVLLDDCRKQHEGEHFDERAYALPPFFEQAKEWLHQQIGLCPSLELVDNHRIVADVEAVLNRALASDNKDPAEQVLFEATQTAWSDLTKAISAPPPDGLESRFFGREPGKPGWAVLFVAFIREQLKDNSRAQVAFVVSRLATVAERLRTGETHLREIRVDVAKLLSYAEEERQKRGIAEGFIREVAGRIVKDESLDFEGQQRAIRNAIEIYVKEISGGVTQSNIDAIVDAALQKAKAQVDKGQSSLARATLRRAAEEMRRDEQERRERYEQGVRLLYQRERDIALAAYDGEAAAQAVIELAEALHGDHHARLWQELKTEEDALLVFGRDRGSNVHLIAAIELDRRLVALAQTADEKGYAHNSLGNALQTLGARESGTARLEEAVGAYRAALEEFTCERDTLAWAGTQTNLGAALQRLGERESGTARLEEAVDAYRAALEERTRERVPLDWATTLHNLGTALWTLGKRESGGRRVLRRRSQPIARRWRNGRASGFRSIGR